MKKLFLTVGMALAVLLSCAKGGDGEARMQYFFIQLSDPQFGFIDSNKSLTAETELFTRGVEIINRLKPAFVVITGDMVNASKSATQIAEFKRIAAKIDKKIPVYLLPGNHDISNGNDQQSVSAYMVNYGYDRFCFDHENTRLIGINSCYMKDNAQPAEGDQFKWLEKQLSKAGNRMPIVFMHHSLFLKEPNEADKYSNISLQMRGKYLDLFAKYGVKAVFAGHLHDLSYGRSGNMEMVTIGAVGKALGNGYAGMNLVKVFDNNTITHGYMALDKFPEKIK